MRYLQNLLYTKRPSQQRLLDIALLLSILPHIFVLKSYMLFYLLVAFFLILKKRRGVYDLASLFFIGFLAMTFSFFSSYNFSDFSRMQFFVSLISSLLILAIALQRLTSKINVYLKLSPIMLMVLSFYFFDTIAMVFYSLFVFFIFILLLLWTRMDSTLLELLRVNAKLFVIALPLVVILFISFPRKSYIKTDFGFRGENYTSSSFAGNMSVSDSPFKSTGRVVMEVFFKDGLPPESELYFRGSTLYPSKNFTWKENSYALGVEQLKEQNNLVHYDLLMYPHGKNWLYTLGIPIKESADTVLQRDYTLQTKKPVYEQKRYSFASALDYRLHSENTEDLLKYKAELYPRTYKHLQHLRSLPLSDEEKALRLLKLFKELNISYTTSPKGLDGSNIIDSFLFDAKSGYCTHFASAFAISARIVGIPSRVVSGYKASYENRVENYILVKQDDAHAWVELYLQEKGWRAYEPTATHSMNLDSRQERNPELKELFHQLNKHYMYTKYLISNWILGFDRIKQMRILESLLSDTLYLIKFLASFLGLLFLSYILLQLIRSWGSKTRVQSLMQELLRVLAKSDLKKERHQTMRAFLLDAQEHLGISLQRIDKLYHESTYSKERSSLDELELEIKTLKRKLEEIRK